MCGGARDGAMVEFGGQFYSIKLHFFHLIISMIFFKSIVKVTNFFIIFLQTIKIVNSYWFAFRPTTYIIILLTNNYSLH